MGKRQSRPAMPSLGDDDNSGAQQQAHAATQSIAPDCHARQGPQVEGKRMTEDCFIYLLDVVNAGHKSSKHKH